MSAIHFQICHPNPENRETDEIRLAKYWKVLSKVTGAWEFLFFFSPYFFEGLEFSIKKNLAQKTSYATAAKPLQSCPTLCDPIPGILQARTLEWVAISFSNA